MVGGCDATVLHKKPKKKKKKNPYITTQMITNYRAFSTNYGKLTQIYQSPGCYKLTQNGNFVSV